MTCLRRSYQLQTLAFISLLVTSGCETDSGPELAVTADAGYLAEADAGPGIPDSGPTVTPDAQTPVDAPVEPGPAEQPVLGTNVLRETVAGTRFTMASVAFGSDDRPAVVWNDFGKIEYAKRNGDGTWNRETLIDTEARYHSAQLFLDDDDNKYLMLVNADTNQSTYAYQQGGEWQFVAIDNGDRLGFPQVAFDGTRPHVVDTDQQGTIQYRIYDGSGFVAETVDTPSAEQSNLLVGTAISANRIHVAFLNTISEEGSYLKLLSRGLDETVWGDVEYVEASVCSGSFSFAVDNLGEAHFACLGQDDPEDNTSNYRIRWVHKDELGVWTSQAVEGAYTGIAARHSRTMISIDAAGRPHIGFHNGRFQHTFLAYVRLEDGVLRRYGIAGSDNLGHVHSYRWTLGMDRQLFPHVFAARGGETGYSGPHYYHF